MWGYKYMLKNICLFLTFSFALISCTTPSTESTEENNNVFAKPFPCKEGTSRQGFIFPTASGETKCQEGTQTCVSGEWSGPYLYDSCENNTKSCDGSPHGTILNGYLQQTSLGGIPCTPATKTCINGTWQGPEVYPSCSEL